MRTSWCLNLDWLRPKVDDIIFGVINFHITRGNAGTSIPLLSHKSPHLPHTHHLILSPPPSQTLYPYPNFSNCLQLT